MGGCGIAGKRQLASERNGEGSSFAGSGGDTHSSPDVDHHSVYLGFVNFQRRGRISLRGVDCGLCRGGIGSVLSYSSVTRRGPGPFTASSFLRLWFEQLLVLRVIYKSSQIRLAAQVTQLLRGGPPQQRRRQLPLPQQLHCHCH